MDRGKIGLEIGVRLGGRIKLGKVKIEKECMFK